MLTIYGIKNCDTVKKALKWLEENNCEYQFHDYKKSGIDEPFLKSLIDKLGWENVLNLKSRTWRLLSDDKKPSNASAALKLAKEQTSIIKRPILDNGNSEQIIGFKAEDYKNLMLKD